MGGGAVQLSGKVPLGARELHWLAGADADYEHVAVHIFAVPGGGSPDSLTESVRTNQVNAGAFAGANLEVVPRLTATAAARYDWIRVPFEDLIDASQNESEEHTSELQSQSNLVCRLLLEKKKNEVQAHHIYGTSPTYT